MDNDAENDLLSSTSIRENAARWQLAETIQDHIDKLNALVDGMSGEDFQDIQANRRMGYICVLTDYLQLLDGDFKKFCELWEVWQKDHN